MKQIYLIIQIMEWYNGDIDETPLFAVSNETLARNDCKRLQIRAYKEDDPKTYRKIYKYEKLDYYTD